MDVPAGELNSLDTEELISRFNLTEADANLLRSLDSYRHEQGTNYDPNEIEFWGFRFGQHLRTRFYNPSPARTATTIEEFRRGLVHGLWGIRGAEFWNPGQAARTLVQFGLPELDQVPDQYLSTALGEAPSSDPAPGISGSNPASPVYNPSRRGSLAQLDDSTRLLRGVRDPRTLFAEEARVIATGSSSSSASTTLSSRPRGNLPTTTTARLFCCRHCVRLGRNICETEDIGCENHTGVQTCEFKFERVPSRSRSRDRRRGR